MHAFADSVCNAIEGGPVHYSGFTAEQSALLEDTSC